MTDMMELADKDFKTVIINMLKDSKKNWNMMRQEMGDIKRTKWNF